MVRKSKILLVYIAAVAGFAIAASAKIEQRRFPALLAGLTPLRLPLNASTRTNVHESFQAVRTERHYVARILPVPTGTPDLDDTVRREEKALLSREEASVFDVEWRIVEGSTVIGQGSGRQKPTAVFWGDSSRGFVLGQFHLNGPVAYGFGVVGAVLLVFGLFLSRRKQTP